MEIGDLSGDLASRLGMEGVKGVVITSVKFSSPADRAGLKSGMVIVEAERRPVTNVAELKNILDKASDRKGGLLLLRSAEGTRYALVK